jgi:hypothetical protein
VSVLAIILVIIGVLAIVFFIGGLVVVRRRRRDPAIEEHIKRADRALEQARAEDRGWERELLDEAARRALETERPGFAFERLDLVLVDDRPGVEEDRAHLLAHGGEDSATVVLMRDAEGRWSAERID